MADAEQVSSTTPNVEGEDEMKPWRESGFSEHTAQDENLGIFGGERYVQEVRVQKADVEGAEEEEEEEEEEEWRRRQEMDVHTPENKAETECLEKSVDLISRPVEFESPEEPDSTQMLDTIPAVHEEKVEEPINLVDLKEVHEDPFTFIQPVHAIQDQDLSSAAHHPEEIHHPRSTSPPEEIAFESEFAVKDQDFGFGVKEEIFEAPVELQKDLRSELEEKKEEVRWNPVVENVGIDSESTPAVSASPSSQHEHPSLIANTQPSFKATMDLFGDSSPSRSVPRYDQDVLTQSDEDLMFETKRNPFQDFSPVEKLDPFGETTADIRAAQMSDSPSPDLVQNAHDGDVQDNSPVPDYEQSFDSREEATESLRQQLASSDFFGTPKDTEESGLPPSLPDILKSSPRKQEKLDSGSSEGSPDFSPVHRSANDSPNAPFSLSTNNPFAFEAKVPLVKEMTEETEARAAERAKIEEEDEEEEGEAAAEEEKASEQMFGTFDLVKEAEISPKPAESATEDQDDFKTLSQDSVQMVDKFECLSFPAVKAQEHSDSESPSADSLSPVLEAMAKNPSSFQIEPEHNVLQEEVEEAEEAEAADEISEQEASSEEFEFVEKPPRGAVDEFLETLENSKFAKAGETLDYFEDAGKFSEIAEASPVEQETKDHAYFLLTEPASEASPARGKAGLELSDFHVPSPAPSAPSAPSPVVQTEMVAVKKADPKDLKLPNLNAGAGNTAGYITAFHIYG
ncbi:reticulon 4b [Silurus asotus]|uniref:Reticulon 4b n=1 Tax=Silurus asotus TaxID=30991 RepID=A0AAD5FAV4_SILAS|nr:reticulon 4b [Silurus asotus]